MDSSTTNGDITVFKNDFDKILNYCLGDTRNITNTGITGEKTCVRFFHYLCKWVNKLTLNACLFARGKISHRSNQISAVNLYLADNM